ncbi:plasmid mobilization protein [Brucella thiophenivorans]|uniref:Bacterial mobilization family protein n=1 Tax=Brucella thiophenivorans TaxID=571255 RepID=A0A256FTS5_9HYPH|nr:plasmid mobilization relaxosome protein MobC [Brucella thiophenivorans]OYR18249.1 bacterial mobilization family protein [Brucella thiophenivorans]
MNIDTSHQKISEKRNSGKKTADHKSAEWKIRLTPEEKAAWQSRADFAQLTLSAYVRRCVEGGITHTNSAQPSLVERDTIIRELSRIGGNLNQIARFVNADKGIKKQELADELYGTIQLLAMKVKEL